MASNPDDSDGDSTAGPDDSVRRSEEADWRAEALKTLQDGVSQNAFLRQQVGQLFDAVRQLYGAVSAQCVQLRDTDNAVLGELQKLQTGTAQRAMAGVYAKLFRDLLKHMNQLDDLVVLGGKDATGGIDPSWLLAVRVARDHFETILRDWGCTPVDVRVGEDEFNPEVHEAVPSAESPHAGSPGRNVVVELRRRGWALSGNILQHPLVLVD